MNLKPTLLAVGLAVACGGLAIAPAALAADGTVTINGKVLSSTCTVSNASGGNVNVTLQPVPMATLSAAGVTANPTAFSLALTGCPTAPSGVKVGAVFDTTNADTTTNKGTLTNTGVTGVDVQVLSTGGTAGTTPATAVTGGTAVPFDGATVTDQVAPDSSGNAVLGYYAQYYATAKVTAGGAVATSATFTLNYQ